jgi:type IV pilus assembly protein PilE
MKARRANIKSSGFTLIEAMIVVAILAIVAAIAYPSYQEHVRKARRTDAQASLFELAQFMERYYTTNGRYIQSNGNAPALPFTESPKEGTTKYYDLSFSGTPTSAAYTLQAAPKGAMQNDQCGALTLSNTGVKGQSNGNASTCWRQ